jgi:hypothetical protein
MSRIEVYLQRRGRWRWRYRDRDAVIPSSRDFGRFQEAVAAARRAYPGVRVMEIRPRLVTARVAAVAAAILLVAVLAGRRAQAPRTATASRARSRSASRRPGRSRNSRSS